MKTAVSELPGSRVSVEVEVDAADVDRGMQRAARSLAREMRLPGFRKGKAPPSLVIQRLGFAAVFEEAIRDSLPEWFERALLDSGVAAVGDPEIEIVSTPEAPDEALAFKFAIGVRPEAKLGDYKGLEVGRAEPEVPDDIVDREIDRVRTGLARLERVERAAGSGDVLVVDFEGLIDDQAFEGGKASDYLLELGGGQLIEGFEEQLAGVSAGDARDVKVTFPTDYQAEKLAGQDAVFAVEVKEVREKVLPDLDDDFASEASEFDTLEELRNDIRERLSEAVGKRIEQDFRIAAIDSAAEAATVEVPDALVVARAEERWGRVERQLAAQGMDANVYLQTQGKSRESVIEESKADALRELRREAVLAAIADEEGIEVSEEELIEALAHPAEHERTTPEKLLARLRESGRDAVVRNDIRFQKALDVVVEAAKPIPIEQAEAREKLWTPEKEREAAGSLWTPDSDS
ncbi:MAG TPA: trigger factor [Solirubrobacterales bacterium]|jgi:trigger factor